ncbi:MAG: redox-sensing transcriptional repressor Rex [Spirochaetales bacterium]|nr:redox-sensing transcriptional repressor Rex [Spirochaetales bacterium]
MNNDAMQPIPLPTIRRFPEYLRFVEDKRLAGEEWISTTEIGAAIGRKSVVVRKDLSYSGVAGHPRRGFRLEELAPALRRSLGWDNATDAFLVGVGSLGQALLGYGGFANYGMRIVAAFDCNDDITGGSMAQSQIFPIQKLPQLAKRMNVKLGIIAVPQDVAQSVANILVDAGIRGIWNFAPVQLDVPSNVVVRREDLSHGLAVLSYQLREECETIRPE